MQNPTRGRVYRRCACRDDSGDQLGPHCPKLDNRSHGRWSYAVDLAPVEGKRKTRRRGGFATKQEARAALAKILEYEHTGLVIDDRQTVGDYLTDWMRTKTLTLKPTTIANYQRYIAQDLLPSLGHLRLETLNHRHVMRFVHDQITAGRGLTTIRRCVATLSSALHDAVRQRRLPHNAARYVTIPRPPKYEPTCWTPTQAARFLRHCADHDDPLTDLFEVIIGTGMRRGEALALHWADINLDERLLFVRYTLSNINNTTPVFTTPKTRSSQAWISLSDRVIAALRRQAARQPGHDLVFTRRTGQPLRPDYVLRHFHDLSAQAGLPRIRVHDLRHFAATTMLSSQVPLVMASRTLRHSTVSTTTEIYAHLLKPLANDAVNTIEAALARCDHNATTSA
ncbi:site-specific integrase [Actinophytocola gossypii]|uniref:Site-specific integrase n=1 Tax=Actinophytocola gossypii TaxID=2812003 RepID=A0ABT2JJ60_9PSEU|nr:site-specific integrase [Actinophytocola gossypii]MCT2587917.1 site-specific integrase [Actinophytocola gossypii]